MKHLIASRRGFLKAMGLGAASLAMPRLVSAAGETKRPSILFIMSDDHASQAISAYGGILAKVAPTANIDRIAKEGMLFKECFCTNSICTPSRAAIFTGKYSHKNGVYKFTALDWNQPTLPALMQKAGYHTAIVGKYHLHSNPQGFDYWSILPGQGVYNNPNFVEMGQEHDSGWVHRSRKRTHYKGHVTDVIGDKALDYLKNRRPKNKPFVFFCHFKAPHDMWEYARRYEDLFKDIEIPEPDNLFDDYSTRTDAIKRTKQKIGNTRGESHTAFPEETKGLTGRALKKKQYQIYMKKFLRCVRGIDDNIGRILDYLDESELAENTVVIYTADQGFFLGEHGLYDKRFMYEESLRMPFIVRWPGRIRTGSVNEAMILNVDFAPTILEIAGKKAHKEMQGRSFVPLLMGKTPSDWRESMYYRYYFSHFDTECHYGVRTGTYKLICFDRTKQWELFDLVKDPKEMNNVYNDPAYQDVVRELKAELKRLQDELGDDPNDRGDNPRTGLD